MKVRNYANEQGEPLFTTLTNARQQCVYLPSRIPPKSDNRCANCESTVVCAPKRREAVTAPFAQNSHSFVGTLYQILFILGEKCIKYVQISFTPFGRLWLWLWLWLWLCLSPITVYKTSQRRSNKKVVVETSRCNGSHPLNSEDCRRAVSLRCFVR
jgi:hypothetical protein